mmetsp:Transcript_45161/g.92184  ORF Transcript_45161/g.92184 Transcript_45161/m.92184 type:complete len:407 (+) Transcript_45161:310-1530(+)|eukprot:CAMPEP_0181299080 /NCGR_PEP_ID=MMETSP1101-20121128/6142_1 /TAXON_ID=46948 /ORGANISM="Rhodomonas abbreviata, Strain Caron Lab Isolate" /LENGTH=406 /DNA_ID=CAMNT_0023404179 /DNA_START=310 /DNA_END=1530 /DNA_ORIENTATION=-
MTSRNTNKAALLSLLLFSNALLVFADTFPWSSAVAGTLTITPVATFYSCNLAEDLFMYSTVDACQAVCQAGECVQMTEDVELVNVSSTMNETGATDAKIVSPGLRIGQVLNIEVEAPGVQVSVDPGLPIGMESHMDPAVPDKLTLNWAPIVGQEGYIHQVVLVTGTAPALSTLLIRVPLLPEAIAWVEPEEGAEVEAIVGMPMTFDFVCSSNYPVTLVAPYFLPPGLSATVMPGMRMLGPGGEPGKEAPARGQLAMTPVHGQEGHAWHLCFHCHSFVFQVSHTRCATLHVALCRYSTAPADTLLSVARTFHRNNNWRRLWNANAGLVADPQLLLTGGTVLTVGSLYSVQPGDTLASIAGRFDTTVRNLLEMNPFVVDEKLLMVGVDLCVTACTNKPNPSFDDRFSY